MRSHRYIYMIVTMHLPNLRRVGVVSATPGRRTTRRVVAVDNANNRAVSSGYCEEPTPDDHESTPADHKVPLSSPGIAPVVIQPHATHGLHGHEGTEQRTNEGHETAENGNGAGNHVRNDGVSGRAADPGHPVRGRVSCKMLGSAKEAHEQVLGCEMHEQSRADQQSGEGDAVADLLHDVSGGTESGRGNVGAAEVVDDASNGDVDCSHGSLAHDESAGVVPGLAHFRNDVEESWGSGVREDDGGYRSKGIGGGGRTEQFEIGLEGASLGRIGGAVLNADSNCQDENYTVR